jgi:hypothetical protein
MGTRAIKSDKHPLSSGWINLFEEMIMAIRFKANLTVDPDGSFRDFEHQNIGNQGE